MTTTSGASQPDHSDASPTTHDHTAGASSSPSTDPYSPEQASTYFEPEAWEERYSGPGTVWSGKPNPQLVTEMTGLAPGSALDVGSGEGGDLIWLAQQGWHATGADFSSNALARATQHAADAGVGDSVAVWQVDARVFEADGRTFDLVTSHYLHPADGGMTQVLQRLSQAVAPGGHLLIVGHAPSADHPATGAHARAMFRAADLLPAVPEGFEVLVAEQRPRAVEREGRRIEIDDSVLHLRRIRADA